MTSVILKVYLSNKIESISNIIKQLLFFFKSFSQKDKIVFKYLSSLYVKFNNLFII